MEIRFNPVRIDSIQSFVSIHNRLNSVQRQVCFVRTEGTSPDLLKDISAADSIMRSSKHTAYCRLVRLPSLSDTVKINECLEKYNNFKKGKYDLFPQYPDISSEISEALKEVLKQLHDSSPNINDTAERNMAVQLIYRTEKHLLDLLVQRREKYCKLIYAGCKKSSEFLFGALAAQLGIDTLHLMPEGSGSIPDKLMQNCIPIPYGDYGRVEFPEYDPERKKEKQDQYEQTAASAVKLHIPPRQNRKAKEQPAKVSTFSAEKAVPRERSYEELALLAESVVMVMIQDETGDTVASGSGIAIHRDGYILTNCHVIGRGASYSVRIENDDKIYDIVDLIKYHPQFDLALIRIQRKMPPLPVYDDRRPLRRGEKVFAIGSPMGLFNSVSDGIISGFRTINDREMIQFTAPISPGSSGGALLNSCGEIIGICTGGIDEGQNLNLAVSYQHIRNFASNVLEPVHIG